jgi:hypothetical protein
MVIAASAYTIVVSKLADTNRIEPVDGVKVTPESKKAMVSPLES